MLEKLPEVLGHALRDRRAGLDKLVFNRCGMRAGLGQMQVTSLAFADHAPIPERYTADGEGVSPPIEWQGVPAGAHSLVLVVEDADAPMGEPLVHAIVVDIEPAEVSLPAGALDSPDHEGDDTLNVGRNSYLRARWLPPDPPPGHGRHRYVFQLFALSDGAAFDGTPGRDAVVQALAERAIASACLIGTYERHDTSVPADDPVQPPPLLV